MSPQKRAHHPRRSAVQKGKGKRPSRHPTKRVAKHRHVLRPKKKPVRQKKKRLVQRGGISPILAPLVTDLAQRYLTKFISSIKI